MKVLVALLSLLIALAGCADSTPSGEPDMSAPATALDATQNPNATEAAMDNETAPEALQIATLTKCKQLHGIFPAPDVDYGLPPGWEPDTEFSGGIAPAVFVYPTKCLEGDVWMVMLGVQPPDEYEDSTVDIDYWSFLTIVSNHSLAAVFQTAGYFVEVGQIELQEQPGGDVWTVESIRSTQAVSAIYGGGNSDQFNTFVQRLWTLNETGEPEAMRMINGNATDFGTGTATFTSDQTDGAPPLAGGISHRVGNFQMELLWDRNTLETG